MTMLRLLRRAPRVTLQPSASFVRNYSQPPNAVDKDHGLDVQSDNAHKGMADHANAQKDAGEQAKQAGGAGKKVSWDNEFPNKPKGPVIGLQDERGEVAAKGTSNGLSPGEGNKGTIAQVESDT